MQNPFKSNIWKMYAFGFFMSFHLMGGVLIPFFMNWGKISFSQIMILQSVFVFSMFVLEIPTGAVADYISRKTSVALGAFFTAIAALIYASYPSFWVFMTAEIVWALGGALISGAEDAILYDSLKKTKEESNSKKVFGRFESFTLVAIAGAAPVGSLIASGLGLRYTMMLTAIPIAIACILALTLKEPKTEKKEESKRYITTIVSGTRYFMKHRALKILAFDMISISVFSFMLIWLYQYVLGSLKFPMAYFGFVTAGICGAEVLVLNSFPKLEKLFGSKKRYAFWSAIITGASFIILGINKLPAIAIVFIIAISGFGLTRDALFRSYINKHIESHNRATVLSSISMIRKFAGAVVYPIIGFCLEWSLGYTLFAIGVLVIILAFVSRVEEKHLID